MAKDKEQLKWEAEEDARTVTRAQEIMADKPRLKSTGRRATITCLGVAVVASLVA